MLKSDEGRLLAIVGLGYEILYVYSILYYIAGKAIHLYIGYLAVCVALFFSFLFKVIQLSSHVPHWHVI